MTSAVSSSPFAAPIDLPSKSIDDIAADPVLVVAPHPDDETLGCGGAIALLRDRNITVRVLVMSDGTRSHPNSRKYPSPDLKKLRESETRSAMSILGVDDIDFLGLPDGDVPMQDAPEANEAIDRCQAILASIAPKVIFLPWRYDPHPDHRATWQLLHRASVNLSPQPRSIEYAIWDWDEAQRREIPSAQDVSVWRLDISTVLSSKKQAIAAYRSQTTDLIDDDPQGFRLLPEFLANFQRPWEVYLEVK
ncbi:MAG: PIG-L deacetylase family protein [Geitlerinemataceae cyanobacterium]